MNQSQSKNDGVLSCPACNHEGQRSTCTSGNVSEIIIYHPSKHVRNVCRIADTSYISESANEISEVGG